MINIEANQLKYEDSPYLQQHANNPVAWYPWGDEAFQKAKKEDKLIFLSIGYSTCHWCHVMEKESFENKTVAKVLNGDFISIKVDREEYPHIDRHYQDIYALMNKRGGGWPLTIVMTPDRRVFFSATYMPPEDKYGRVGLKGMMKVLLDAYHDKKDAVLKSAKSIEDALRRIGSSRAEKKVHIDASITKDFIQEIVANYDAINKGIGTSPKFPHASTLNTLLDIFRLDGDKKALQIATETLMAMSKGGIYDQIEGGFYRYSVDEMWLIPHFEKMLYTNGELLAAYANAYAVTKKKRFKRVVEETITNMNERFFKEGLYYSASDADSDGKEGKYFLFDYHDTLKDLKEAGLSSDVLDYFAITPKGNFEENLTNPSLCGMERLKDLEKAKRVLRVNREKKSYPFIDHKIQTSWNGLYLLGLFKSARYVDKRYAADALYSLDSLIKLLYHDNELYHQVIIGKSLKVKGYLEDYAFLIAALIEAYQVDFNKRYLSLAQLLSDKALSKFYKEGQWYMSDDRFLAKAEFYDASYASSLAIMIENLFKLALLSDNQKLYAFAKESLKSYLSTLKSRPSQYPSGLNTYLKSLESLVVLKSTKENLQNSRELLDGIRYPYLLLKESENENYIACKIGSCFAIEKSVADIISKINSL